MSDARARAVAIVGRPNVGKSALFNRMAGRRLAIVHEQEGVTRDRLICEVVRDGVRFELADTGGVGAIDNARAVDRIDAGIRAQVDCAIQDADVLILTVDVRAGRTPLDVEMSRILRRSGRSVITAANKADDPALDALTADFEPLGFPCLAVSAMHNRGIDELVAAVREHLPPAPPAAERRPLKVAVVGRPNAGKSSYINRLLRSERVIVSEVPGTTRDSIEVPFSVGQGPQARHYELIDTAGIKQRRKIKDSVEFFSMVRAEQSIERADVVVLAIDAVKGATAQEKKIASLIHKNEKGCLLLVTKWDLMEHTTQRTYAKELRHALPFLDHVPAVFVSSESGFNVRRSIEAVDYVADQIDLSLGTGLLNRVLREAWDAHQPTADRGRRLKLYYAVQTGTRPVRIKCFVNDPRGLSDNYRRYLIGRLRAAFGLEGAPVILLCAARHPPRKNAEKKKKGRTRRKRG